MATDTARVQLELASGKNEDTAPFHQTAQRRRKQRETDAASVDAPASHFPVDMSTGAVAPSYDGATAQPRPIKRARDIGGPHWVAFIVAMIAVAGAVWWVMLQRLPDIDPREVIARNLNDAQTAMADGRYTDPPERSAFHYYSTVLALAPTHAEAIAGIDAIAERHLTNARVLLADQRIAEAGVALEKARRVRPDHNGLAVLDAQWRTELRKIIAAATAAAKPVEETLTKPPAAKKAAAATGVANTRRTRQPAADGREAPRVPAVATPAVARPAPAATAAADTDRESIADVRPLAATLAATRRSSTQAGAGPAPIAESAAPVDAANTGANVVEDTSAAVAPPPPAAVESSVAPKLIKMVQPAYPQDALIRGMEGWVDVSLQVSATGDVIDPRVEGSSRGRMFNRAALNAVQQWKYEPREGDTSERVRVRLQFRQSK
jgi:TonB family protein